VSAAGPTDPSPRDPPRRGATVVRLAVQAAGFLVGLGLLWWCVAEALKPENRDQLARLGEAGAAEVAALIGLSIASVLLNGSLFWVTLRPVRRLNWLDVQATNVIASVLALLPFKLSVLWRVLVHRGRDGVPLLTIGAWFSAMAVLLLVSIGPAAAAAAWAATLAEQGRQPPSWWLAAPVIGSAALAAAMVGFSRLLAHDRGWATVDRAVNLVPSERARGLVRERLLPRAHEGVRMLGAPGPVAAAVAMRLADVAVQTARFLVAASVVGQTLSPELAVLAASAYFLIGVLAPTGALGVREAGTAGVFALLATEDFKVVIITITAVETLVLLGGAVLAAVRLRVDRLLRLGGARTPAVP
jgi:hypothetical protein